MTTIMGMDRAERRAVPQSIHVGIFLSTLGMVRGGLETIATKFAQGLLQRGHEVTCVSGAEPGAPLSQDLADSRFAWVHVPMMPLTLSLWRGTSARSQARRLKAQSMSFAAACRLHPGARHLLATADVTLSFLEIETVYLSRLRAANDRRHVSYFPGVIDRKWLDRDRSDLRLAISHTLADAVPEVPIDAVVAPGIDEDWLKLPFEIRGEAEVLFFAGRLETNKGVWELLHIFEALASERPALRLRLAGDGPLRSQLEDWVRRQDLGSRITFLGAIPPAQLKVELGRADLFLFPTHYESFGLAVVEAQAAGLPVVCSDLAIMQESAGGAAFLLPPRDITQWIEGVRVLLGDVEARRRLSHAGRSNAERLTWSRAVEALEGYLLEACTQV